MQGSYSSSDRTESGIFGRVLASSHSLFTPKRVGFTLAGAFVFAGAAAAIGIGGSQQPSHTKSQNFTVQTSSDNTTGTQNTPTEPQTAADTNSTTTSGTVSNSSSVNVTVNGKNIAVPENGSIHQTVPTEDGNGKSSVSVTASNDSSNSTLNVNISSSNSGTSNSSSHSSSHTVITQNGSTTITNSH
jgi:hypothetical protein